MAISDGLPVNAATDNAAFISRTNNSNTVAVVSFERPSGSGPSVSDAQRRLNDAIFRLFSEEEIASGGEVSNNTDDLRQYRRIKGLGAAQTASGTPFGTAGGWPDGTIIRLIGTDDTNTVTLVNNDSAKGLILNGDITLVKYQSITLMYDSFFDRWIEQGRN